LKKEIRINGMVKHMVFNMYNKIDKMPLKEGGRK